MPKRRDLSDEEWLGIALTAIAQYEYRVYQRYLEHRILSESSARQLMGFATDLIDRTRRDGQAGYLASTNRSLQPSWRVRWARWAHYRLGISIFLQQSLTQQFHTLYAWVLVMEELMDVADERVAQFVYRDQMQEVIEAVQYRLDCAQQELDQLSLAHPNFGHELEARLHRLSITRLELQKYRDMLDSGIIGTEVFDELDSGIERQVGALSSRSQINLEATSDSLLELPVFAGVPAKERQDLISSLPQRVLPPDTALETQAQPSDGLYIISSGLVRWGRTGGTIFGSGEIIRVHDTPTALHDMQTIGYTRLRILPVSELSRLDPA